MNKLKTIAGLLLMGILLAQCSKDSFLIEKNSVGLLSNTDVVSDIESIFINDSIVKNLSEGDFGDGNSKYLQDNDEYLVYSKEGKHLVTIVPKIQHDSISTIKYVEIMNPQFKTEKGLTLNSPFKDINVNYRINKIEASLYSATLYIDELNATITLDKSDLGINQFSTEEIKVAQIPDMAKIKSITIWFD